MRRSKTRTHLEIARPTAGPWSIPARRSSSSVAESRASAKRRASTSTVPRSVAWKGSTLSERATARRAHRFSARSERHHDERSDIERLHQGEKPLVASGDEAGGGAAQGGEPARVAALTDAGDGGSSDRVEVGYDFPAKPGFHAGTGVLGIDSQVAVTVMEHEDGEVCHLRHQRAERSRDDGFQLAVQPPFLHGAAALIHELQPLRADTGFGFHGDAFQSLGFAQPRRFPATKQARESAA